MAASSIDSTNSTPRHDRVFDDSLEDVEAQFLHAVDFGDVTQVKDMLEEHPGLNVDCTDALGRTPLRLAVKNENKELVEILLNLSNAENMNAAVLQAIDSTSTSIAALALRHPRYQDTYKRMRRMGETDNFFKPERGSQFPSYVTPLNLAAQKNQFPIVQLLLQRGDTITRPHKFGCICQECINKNKFDQLRFAQCRLDSYRGLASEAYISLYSKDPFLTAFELASELRTLANQEVCFKTEYIALADQLSRYTVKLLDRVWTQRELSAVLDKTGSPSADKFESLARLQLAIDCQEKLFVSHPNCQQRIVRCWYQGLGWIGRTNWRRRLLVFPASLIVYPAAVAVFLAAPRSRVGKFLSQPAIKFLSHTISFFIFLMLIIISSLEGAGATREENSLKNLYPELHETYNNFRNATGRWLCGENFPLRPQNPTVTEILIMIWVVAMVVQECQEIWEVGYRVHLKDKFNIMDFLLLSVYMATYSVRILVMRKVRSGLDWLRYGNVLSDEMATEIHVYWMNSERWRWAERDPINFAEGLFAMANILSFSRIAYILPANEALGPMQISLGRMLEDILKFFALAIIVVAAFMVALRNLFWYYANRDRIELHPEKIPDPTVVEYYGSEKATFRTVFWSIYGRGSVQAASLGDYNNTVTEDIGESIDAMYHIVMIIVMLNILIAMMSRSFEMIAEDADAEWKFARSALYMDYMKEGRVLPVPLNVIEVPKVLIRRAVHCGRDLWSQWGQDDGPVFGGRRRDGVSNIASQRHLKRRNSSSKDNDTELTITGNSASSSVAFITRQRLWSTKRLTLYQEVIQSIIQRFIFDIQRENEISGAGFDDVKSSLSHLRYEVMAEYNIKDATLALAMDAVHSIAREMSIEDPYFGHGYLPWAETDSVDIAIQSQSPNLLRRAEKDTFSGVGMGHPAAWNSPDVSARSGHARTARERALRRKGEGLMLVSHTNSGGRDSPGSPSSMDTCGKRYPRSKLAQVHIQQN
ncbi:short transient receptor potential channel 6 [Plakobranchus ocellatus]|uniref:Short transient receptor potential channel 6 n=1 Tax=Plakobranchus ocellatus TaxID=259542 RepID=A0AAV4C1M6_9GAST|nr:short transient receptor potential channel 6 [Plakobranchus ocellatus]